MNYYDGPLSFGEPDPPEWHPHTYSCGDRTCGAPDCRLCNPRAEDYVRHLHDDEIEEDKEEEPHHCGQDAKEEK